jgi:D-alanyl-D-alanine carboxypeptidase/D-alanyl-D-alanine-endopeptidase (penicillin-binding protein 4)
MIKNSFLLVLFICTISFTTSKEVIRSRIESLLDNLPKGTIAGILIFNPLTEDTIYQLNYTHSMIPASNTKLFTTATALSIMGGGYPLKTILFTTDKDIKDGVIDGDLFIKGFGNSVLTSDDIDTMAMQLRAKGIKKVTGNIIGDDSYFDEIYTRDDWIRDEKANVKLPPISALVVDRNRTIVYRKRGRYKRRYVAYVKNPPLNAAIILKDKLEGQGIDIDGRAVKGVTPPNVIQIAESKILLKDLIREINKHSDNFLAECLFKTIGAVTSGNQGNSFYSTQAILKFIKDNGIYSDGTAVVDGSGISRYDQITPGAIVGLLEKMYFDLIHYKDFYNSLSIAGVDGTLRHRLNATYAENNFHGKTGTLKGVCSLSGYLTTKSKDEIILSIFFDFKHRGENYYRNIQDEIVKILADWE